MGNSYGPKIATDGLVLCVDGSSVDPTYGNFNDNDVITEFYNLQPNGSTGEETLEIGLDPWGRQTVLDRSLNNDTTSNYDGGDTSGTYSISSSVKYRYTFWFRVDKKGSNGTLYFGLYGYNSSSTNIAVRNNAGVSGTTNPYFSYVTHANSNFQEGRWYMLVTYVHPAGSTYPTDSTAGFYDMVTKAKITNPSSGNVSHNPVWDSTHTKALFRYYLYYSTDPTVEMSWYEPRIDLVDGNEPSVTDMLNHPPNRLTNIAGTGYNARGRNGLTYDSTYKALNFTRSNYSHLVIADHDDIDITGDMTIECWVYLNSAMNGNLCILVNKRDASDYTTPFTVFFEDRASENKYGVTLGGVSPNYLIVGSNGNFNGTYNKWDHVVFTITGTAAKVFVNGSAGGTGTFSGTRQTNTVPIRIGGIYSWNTTGYELDGKMGAVRIYSRALNAAEIANNYNTHKDRYS